MKKSRSSVGKYRYRRPAGRGAACRTVGALAWTFGWPGPRSCSRPVSRRSPNWTRLGSGCAGPWTWPTRSSTIGTILSELGQKSVSRHDSTAAERLAPSVVHGLFLDIAMMRDSESFVTAIDVLAANRR